MGCLEINEVSLIRKMSKVEWDLKSQSILVLKNRVEARQAILVYDKKDLEWASERGQREVEAAGEEVGGALTGSR